MIPLEAYIGSLLTIFFGGYTICVSLLSARRGDESEDSTHVFWIKLTVVISLILSIAISILYFYPDIKPLMQKGYDSLSDIDWNKILHKLNPFKEEFDTDAQYRTSCIIGYIISTIIFLLAIVTTAAVIKQMSSSWGRNIFWLAWLAFVQLHIDAVIASFTVKNTGSWYLLVSVVAHIILNILLWLIFWVLIMFDNYNGDNE